MILENPSNQNQIADPMSLRAQDCKSCAADVSYHKLASVIVLLLAAICASQSLRGQNHSSPYSTGDDVIAYLDSRQAFFENITALYGVDSAKNSGLTKHLREMSKYYPALSPSGTMSDYRKGIDESMVYFENTTKNLNVSSWEEIGPFMQPDNTGLTTISSSQSPLGIGPLNFISFSPSGDRIFTGGWSCGMFYSDDDGETWTNGGTDRVDRLEEPSVCDVKAAYFDENIWFMTSGAGDKFSDHDPGITWEHEFSRGVFRTVDAGTTWESIGDMGQNIVGLTPRYSVMSKVLVHPTDDPQNLRLLATSSRGIFRASNAMGQAENEWPGPYNPDIGWQRVFDENDIVDQTIIIDGSTFNLEQFWAYDMHQLYNSDGTISPNSVVVSGTAHYVTGALHQSVAILLQSDDFGETWTELQSSIVEHSKYERYSIDVVSTAPNSLFINAVWREYVGDNAFIQADFITFDMSQSSSATQELVAPMSLGSSEAFSVDPLNTDRIFLNNGIKIRRFIPSSNTYWNPGGEVSHDDTEVIEHSPDGSRVWMVTHGGLYTCNPDGTEWDIRNNGLGIAEITDMANNRNGPEYFLASAWHDGTFQSYPTSGFDELNWRVVSGGDGAGAMINPFDYTNQYSSSQFADGWSESPPALDGSFTGIASPGGPGPAAKQYAEFSTRLPGLTFDGAYHLMRNFNGMSSNGTWEQITPDTWGLGEDSASQITGIWPSEAHEDLLFVQINVYPNDDYRKNVLFISNRITDSTIEVQASWAEIEHPLVPLGLEPTWIIEVLTDEEDRNVFYVVTSKISPIARKITKYEYTLGDILTASQSEISNMSNYEITDLSFNLTDMWLGVSNAAFIPGAREIFITMGAGVFYATEDELMSSMLGDSPWEMYGDDLPYVKSNALIANYSSDKLLTGLGGRGIWQNDLPCWQDPDLILSQNLTIKNFARYHQNIIVPDGITMIVQGELQMATNTSIDVLPGGELIIDGGTITNACEDGLNDLAEDVIGTLLVYPTPTTGELHLFLPYGQSSDFRDGGRASIDLFDALGRIIPRSQFKIKHTGDNQESITLDIESLSSGTYLLRLLTDEGLYSAHILKE